MSLVLPDGFATYIANNGGHALASAWAAGSKLPAKAAIRLNPLKEIALPADASAIAWCADGYALATRPAFAQDPLWHAGAYYVQEAASMAVGQAVGSLAPAGAQLALDLCAAPGGKSTHLQTVLPATCLLVCNEVIRTRVSRLQENLERWGHPGYAVISADPAFLGNRCQDLFDVIVVDAPCSGEGLFRKDANAAAEWSPGHVQFCAVRQQRILADIWPALKPGGLLVYSTCTLNTTENEGVFRFLLEKMGAEPAHLPDAMLGLGRPSEEFPTAAVRFLPDGNGAEGLFLAAVYKPGELEVTEPYTVGKKETDKLADVSTHVAHVASAYVPYSKPSNLFIFKDEVFCLPEHLKPIGRLLLSKLPILTLGQMLGVAMGKIFIPGQGGATLAFSSKLAHTLELTLPQALQYLKKDELRDVLMLEPGTYLASYKNCGLGWLKAIQGGRINNMLPPNRRLRQNMPLDTENDS